MAYEFLDKTKVIKNGPLPESDKINSYLLKNDTAEIRKGIEFLDSEEKFLYVHGFLGTGKRQYINYISDFCSQDVIKLEYYCKPSTVCDDILLAFLELIDNNPVTKPMVTGTKLLTLPTKFNQYINLIRRPFLIILHSFDDVVQENKKLIADLILKTCEFDNVKFITSTRGTIPDIFNGLKIDTNIVLKAFSKEIFKEYLSDNNISYTETVFEDFYKYTRGYYYYTVLTIKIILAMKIDLNEFLTKYAQSGQDYDTFIGMTYINIIPEAIRNFFWFLRTLRHGITLNALAVLELYDDFSINYLVTNLMAFISNETIYVQDYFQQNIDISIPAKIEIKLHKYIVNIYEKELKKTLINRDILLSRQALRAEIEYHNQCVTNLINGEKNTKIADKTAEINTTKAEPQTHLVNNIPDNEIGAQILLAKKLTEEKKYTDAIEKYLKIIETMSVDLGSLTEIRVNLARLYKDTDEPSKAEHYYELAEIYYKQNKEVINLNYLYYEIAELFSSIYKRDRAIETLKKVVYSVDTPQSLMVSACTLMGNIYSDMNNSGEAYNYYQKALSSFDEYTSEETIAELYFKYALACDDNGDMDSALEYYNKCISVNNNNLYRAPAYSNLGLAYYENGNYTDSKDCFLKAYNIEKENNNYDGIYYTAKYLAKIGIIENSDSGLKFLTEAKQSAEFLNEPFYIMESSIALGDYYYNNVSTCDKALIEYFQAKKQAEIQNEAIDISKILERINDMKLRMNPEDFEKIETKYGK